MIYNRLNALSVYWLPLQSSNYTFEFYDILFVNMDLLYVRYVQNGYINPDEHFWRVIQDDPREVLGRSDYSEIIYF